MRLASAFCAIGLALAAASPSAQAAEVTLNLSNEYSATNIQGVGDAFFADLVDRKTNGGVAVAVHYGGSLGFKSADHFDAVGEGALALADTYGGALGGLDPLFLLPSLPFLVSTVDEAAALYEIAEPEFRKIFEANNQILLYASPWPPSGLWAKKPIDSVDAIRGVKVRSFDKNSTTALNALGASAIRLSWADVVPAISTGAIDAVLTSAEGGVSSRFWEYFDTFSEVDDYAIPLSFVHMNKDAFDALSADRQAAILAAAAETREHNWGVIPERVRATYAELGRHDVTVVEPTDEAYRRALRDAGKVALDEWLASAGPRGRAIIDAFDKRMGR